MIARALALLVCVAVALTGAPAPDADAGARKKGKRTPVCKTKKASKKAARQAKRKRRCRPQRKHLRKRVVRRTAPAPAAPGAPVSTPAPAVQPAVPLAPPPAAPAREAEPAPEIDPTCGPSRNLGAIAEDADGFRLRLTRTCLPAGEVAVNWQNTDSSEHDLWATPLSAPAGTLQKIIDVTLTTEMPVYGDVTLTAGRWELFCSLSGHGSMRAEVTVTP